MKIHHRTFEGEGSTGFCLNDFALCRPSELAVSVVAVKRRSDDGTVKAVVPLATDAFLRPFAHPGHVGNGRVHLLGRRGDASGDLGSCMTRI